MPCVLQCERSKRNEKTGTGFFIEAICLLLLRTRKQRQQISSGNSVVCSSSAKATIRKEKQETRSFIHSHLRIRQQWVSCLVFMRILRVFVLLGNLPNCPKFDVMKWHLLWNKSSGRLETQIRQPNSSAQVPIIPSNFGRNSERTIRIGLNESNPIPIYFLRECCWHTASVVRDSCSLYCEMRKLANLQFEALTYCWLLAVSCGCGQRHLIIEGHQPKFRFKLRLESVFAKVIRFR